MPIGRKALTAIAVSIALTGCVATGASVTTEYYAVRGTNADEIDRELRRNGPLKGHALAAAAIRFVPANVMQQQDAGGCRFRTAVFRVEAKITLPDWKNRSQSNDRELRRAWDNLSRYAKAHEDMHVKIAKQYADLLGKAIKAIPAQKDCQQLDKVAARIVKTVSREHNRTQLAFDAAEQKRLAAIFAAAERR